MDNEIVIVGLDEAIQKYSGAPRRLNTALRTKMDQSLMVLQENVPPYPPPPPNSTYRRTGTLGRSLGSGMGGNRGGRADIYRTVRTSNTNIEGYFGTRVNYAPYVIGDNEQAYMHKGRWWTMGDVKTRAETKIKVLWRDFVDLLLGD